MPLALLNATNLTLGTNVTLSGQTNATLTIFDAESGFGTIGFSSASYSVSETASSATITVVMVPCSAAIAEPMRPAYP